MSRLFYDRRYFRPTRYHSLVYIKCFLFLTLLYLLNLIFGVQYYVWTEKSFDNEYHLTMTNIDFTKINENNIEQLYGPAKSMIPNKFIISNENLCSNNKSSKTGLSPHLLILVKSAIENWKARQAIRLTWANKEFLGNNSIKLAFILGKSKDNISITTESQKYNDLIQIDKIDFYYHNSYKMIMMLRWINDYCTSNDDLKSYVLFIDDDYYLNLNSLLKYINKIDEDRNMTNRERQSFITGYLYESSRPRRFINDRWYISINDYPYDRYPPYVTAGCFLMTRSNAKLFYLSSKYTRLFRFDDVYMGLLAYSMSIKFVRNNDLFSSYGSSTILLENKNSVLSKLKMFFNDYVNGNSSVQPICIHGYRGEDLIQIWNDIYKTNITITQ